MRSIFSWAAAAALLATLAGCVDDEAVPARPQTGASVVVVSRSPGVTNAQPAPPAPQPSPPVVYNVVQPPPPTVTVAPQPAPVATTTVTPAP